MPQMTPQIEQGAEKATERIALINGRIRTPKGLADSVMIEAGRVASVGASPVSRAGGAKVVDLRGRTVFPGFCDSHARFMRWACAREQVQLDGRRSIDDLRTALNAFVAERSPLGGWRQGYGWDRELLMGVEPTRQDLDPIVPDVPTILWSRGAHEAVVNTVALQAAGITRETRVESGLVQLGPDGEPTGLLRGDAVALVARRIPPLGDEELSRVLRTHAPEAAALGLTEICSDDLSLFGGDFRRARRLFMGAATSGWLPFRLRSQLHIPELERFLNFLSDGWRSGDGIPFYQVGPLKLLCDDAPGDAGPRHQGALLQQEELDELVLAAHLAGMQVALHAAGREALDRALTSFERAQARRSALSRHLVLHAQAADDDQLDRMRRLRIGAVVHPCSLPEGQEPGGPFFRWHSMMRGTGGGIVLSFGSDAPDWVSPPLACIQAAVTRMSEERLSVAEAFGACTWNGAWNGRNEGRRGEIAPGRDADLVVLDQDPFAVSPEDLADVGVAMTVCAGRVVYDPNGLLL